MSNSNLSNSNCTALSFPNEDKVIVTVEAKDATPQPGLKDNNTDHALASVIEPPATSITATEGPGQVGWMNGLFEAPTPHLTGPDAPAHLVDMGPLHRVGTADRDQFDRAHEVVIQVLFKIHTKNEVVITNSNDSTSSSQTKPSTARRSVGTTVNVIDSKVFNDGVVHELRACVVGLSLNQFKERCAELCERYAPGMHQMVINSEVAPNLTWKASVGL
ncbi:uncharacterized protein MELLADRAFT_63886 [Melampsora larici-populina 98AG31]|uniref:Uncharacterized protein n=1 Tax=Melampsora larici-populina (strain 98AG31 / pathotype 3-4-7) TaxID=747676 RepID=F4RNV8_MELLP|nr:uncharacterized protein MELLADRAFT_63886 [Melampsora larici-populina 98AG31]EGG05813.1 hypothetical protein MELLADRAFT_63886 [Melampsora larici-populina 98AG31]